MGPINPNTITFDAPTRFTDGTPIPVGTITRYEYGFGQSSRQYTVIVPDDNMTPDANGKQDAPLTIAGQLAYGQWYAASRAVSKDGPVSAWSNEAAFELRAKEPEAPTGFTVA